jgi:carbon starvation protein
VHDFIILYMSVRQNGESLSRLAQRWQGSLSGTCTAIAILFIIIVAIASLAIVVVNALSHSAWGTFTIAASIPIALLMGQGSTASARVALRRPPLSASSC